MHLPRHIDRAGRGQRALGWAVPDPCPTQPQCLMHSYTLQGLNHPTDAAGITFLPTAFVAANTSLPAPCHKHLQNNVGDREWLGHRVALVPPVTCTVPPGRVSSQGPLGVTGPCFFLRAESLLCVTQSCRNLLVVCSFEAPLLGLSTEGRAATAGSSLLGRTIATRKGRSLPFTPWHPTGEDWDSNRDGADDSYLTWSVSSVSRRIRCGCLDRVAAPLPSAD